MTFGWRGQFLRVNLTSGKLGSEPLLPEEVKDSIGAHGLAIHLYNKEVPAEVRRKMKFKFVKTIGEALSIALGNGKPSAKRP